MTPKEFQERLAKNGYALPLYGPDGFWGDETEKAIKDWFASGEKLYKNPPKDKPPPDPNPGEQRISAEGVAFLHGWESCRLTAYKDSGGVWTIGWGHTSGAGAPTVSAGMTITQAEADAIFLNDIVKFEQRVREQFGLDIPQRVFDGATSFDYNTGAVLNNASWPNYWMAGDYPTSEEKLKLWNKAGGEVVNGLVKRRAAEADMIFRGDYSGRP